MTASNKSWPAGEVPVLIVGGSLVGLSLAVFLGWHGVRALVVEQHRGTAVHPRAGGFTQRTIEAYRSVGLEPAIRGRADAQFIQDGAIMAVESLAGRELRWFLYDFNEGARGVSPTARVFITQDVLEPILRARAEELGADLRFGARLERFDADADGVSAVVTDRDSGEEHRLRARIMVACDGGRSLVRQHLGIGMTGRHSFSHSVTIYFSAPLAPLIGNRRLSIIYVNNPALRGFLRLSKASDAGFLVVNTVGDETGSDTANVGDGITEERCRALLRAAIGADVPVKVESILAWQAAAEAADSFRRGPVFLAGDAAHTMPPNGGFGGNTGVGDAHNLAWKLALVLAGKAAPALLDSYDAERRPVAAFTAEQAYARYVRRTAPYLGTAGLADEVDDIAIELGYRYHSRAVPGDSGAGLYEDAHHPSGRPGTRAPHLYIESSFRRTSTLDLLGRRFVLFAGADGAAWCDAARGAAEALGVELDAYRLGTDALRDPAGRLAPTYGIGAAGAILMRPDGFIAWRAPSAADPKPLAEALAAILARPLP